MRRRKAKDKLPLRPAGDFQHGFVMHEGEMHPARRAADGTEYIVDANGSYRRRKK
jgi:hypothetical protein